MTNAEKRLVNAIIANMADENIVELVEILAYTATDQVVSFPVWKGLKSHIEGLGYNDTHKLVTEVDGKQVEVDLLQVVKA